MTLEQAIELSKKGFEYEPQNNMVVVLPITEDKLEHYENIGIIVDEGTKRQVKAEESHTLAKGVVLVAGPGAVENGHFIPCTFKQGDIVLVYNSHIDADLILEGQIYFIISSKKIFLKKKVNRPGVVQQSETITESNSSTIQTLN